jgi:SAM-dependent methyltransferase
MSNLWEELCRIICCPEDGEQLAFSGSGYSCRACSGWFPILFGRIADLRPRSPRSIPRNTNSEFDHDYSDAFHHQLQWSEHARAWGATELVSARWARRREREVRHIQLVLKEQSYSSLYTFCDVSAGAGYYTLASVDSFPLVLHCDLSCDSLVYAAHKAEKLGVDNMAFIRLDYLQPPFAGRLDCVICMDSLERGEDHERMLLRAIRRSLRPSGIGVVDFHNWWHNPLRRLGFLPENFGLNRSYSRSEAEALLRSCGIRKFKYIPFYQECDPTGKRSRIVKAVLPPTRHVFFFEETQSLD